LNWKKKDPRPCVGNVELKDSRNKALTKVSDKGSMGGKNFQRINEPLTRGKANKQWKWGGEGNPAREEGSRGIEGGDEGAYFIR